MSRTVACAIAAAVGLVLSQDASARQSCGPGNSTNIVANGIARVFGDGAGGYDACRLKGHRIFFLGTESPDGGPSRFRVAGPRVAWADVECSRYDAEFPCSGAVKVLNVRTGHRVSTGAGRSGGVGDLVLTAGGTVAWTVRPIHTVLADAPARVFARVRGKRVLLDSGDDIDVASLAAGGHVLYWLKGGRPVSAAVP
jgi:hypothetical protein